ncbi:hypothetical protein GCK72_003309 [Caenorhabditis remanei]|uniref:F-box domain-containing protein n=1 Tax=Caenorhabditis remanei TaxID=31234 RepID=A0A6A5HYR3_CAERE|nr:hypothetical protein GCK72_003309 [Caenorhabditis remanei]KAF1771482.1 hypothetical protein GCK72_003309 [Caenorhabditis remanei]
MSTVFHLFSLPYLPLKRVLDNVGPEALLYISLCSRRAKNVAVSYKGPSKNVQLNVHFGHKNCLSYMEGVDIYWLLNVQKRSNLSYVDRNLATVRIGNFCGIPVEMGELGMNTYWDDCMVGITEIGDHAREIFNQDFYEVCVYDKQEDGDHRRAAEWIKNSQGKIQSLHCDFKPQIDNDLDFILENVEYTRMLSLHVNPPPNYHPAKPPNFSIDFVYMIFSFWIKQDHLLTMNCEYIVLQDSKLSSQDFNAFLKHWMAGDCSKLKLLRVDVEELIDYQIVLDGAEFVKRERDVARVYVDEEEHHHTIRGGFDAKRPSDNVTATITNGGQISKFFLMIVWPDSAENSYED